MEKNKKLYGWWARAVKPEVTERMLEAGAVARIESSSRTRFSPGGAVAFGALGAAKQSGGVYLYFADPQGIDIEMVVIKQGDESRARKWVIEYNKELVRRREMTTDAS